MRVAVGSDESTHLTDWVVKNLQANGVEVELYGALTPEANTRWPEVARQVAENVADGRCQQGVLFCNTGTGVSIAANKVAGVRAALCADAETAKKARLWNDANVLCMSLRLTSPQIAIEILDAWSSTSTIDETEQENIDQVIRMDRTKE